MKYITLTIVVSILYIAQSEAQNISQIFDKVSPSVVIINTTEKEILGRGQHKNVVKNEGIGSGVLISEDGMIMTAAHVVQTAEDMEVLFSDGQRIPAKPIRTDQLADVAMIKLMWPPKNPTVAKIGDSDKTKIGERIFVIGSPYGIAQTLSVGYISGRHSKNGVSAGFINMEFFQTDAAINHGNSGGPMFNMNGEIIGIVSYILSESGGFQGLGFAATSNVAKTLLIDSKESWTGINGKYVTGAMAEMFNVPQKMALYVQKVATLSPADICGIKGGMYQAVIEGEEIKLGGDFILGVDGIKIENEESIVKIRERMASYNKGEKFPIEVLRGGKIIELNYIVP